MPTLEFNLPNGEAPKNDKGNTTTSKDAVTISYSSITGLATAEKLNNLPHYIKWTSGTMTCTIKKKGGLSSLPLAMKIGTLTIFNKSDGIPITTTASHTVEISPNTTNIDDVITLSGNGSYSIQDPSWIFGQDDTTVGKSYTYSNTGLTINYDNPKFTINGLSNNSAWGEIVGAGAFEISSKNQELTQTITATPKPNCRFLCWTDGVTTPARTISLKESELTSENTILTYSALFAPTALYVGTKPVSAVYVGTKKAKVYRGTTRIL